MQDFSLLGTMFGIWEQFIIGLRSISRIHFISLFQKFSMARIIPNPNSIDYNKDVHDLEADIFYKGNKGLLSKVKLL